MEFRHYRDEDYEALRAFLIALNQDHQDHINWNWARFEWMSEHPECDKSATDSIGLWCDGGGIVGAAIYDMYFGEAFVGVLPQYIALYPEALGYAYRALKDDTGLGVAICDDCTAEIRAAEAAGFSPAEQDETIMSLKLSGDLAAELPEGMRVTELDPAEEAYDFQWILWQGFDHGTDRAAFEAAERIIPQIRRNLNPYLSLAAVDRSGNTAAYCCLWYDSKTDYAYVEPVCTAPPCRGKGVAKALLYEALNRACTLGAKTAYVISDSEFYHKLGFTVYKHFTFYHKD